MNVDISDESTWPTGWELWVKGSTPQYESPVYGQFDTLVFDSRGGITIYSPPTGSGYVESYVFYRVVEQAYLRDEMIRVVPETLDPKLAADVGREIGRNDVGESVLRHRNGYKVSRSPRSGPLGWLTELRSRLLAFCQSPSVSIRPTGHTRHEIDVGSLNETMTDTDRTHG